MPKKKPVPLTVEIVSVSPSKAENLGHANGWGEDSQRRLVTGEIREITITRGGEPRYALRIDADGNLVLTTLCGLLRMTAETNLRLEQVRPWTSEDRLQQKGKTC